MKSESYKNREEELKVEYENFLKTKEGQEWKNIGKMKQILIHAVILEIIYMTFILKC